MNRLLFGGISLAIMIALAPPTSTLAQDLEVSASGSDASHEHAAHSSPSDLGRHIELFVEKTAAKKGGEAPAGLGSNNVLRALSDIAWEMLSDFAVELLSGNEAELFSGNQADFLSGNTPHLLSDNAPELSGNATELFSGNEAAILAENQVSIFSNNTFTFSVTESGNNSGNQSPMAAKSAYSTESHSAQFKVLDTNGDQVLTLVEFDQGRQGKKAKRARRRFKRLDRNQDGKVTHVEYVRLTTSK